MEVPSHWSSLLGYLWQHYHQYGDILIVADEGDFPGLISSLAGWATGSP